MSMKKWNKQDWVFERNHERVGHQRGHLGTNLQSLGQALFRHYDQDEFLVRAAGGNGPWEVLSWKD